MSGVKRKTSKCQATYQVTQCRWNFIPDEIIHNRKVATHDKTKWEKEHIYHRVFKAHEEKQHDRHPHGEHFTAGLDLMELQDKWDKGAFEFSDDEIDPWGIGGKLRTKPVVVAIQGTCFTAGIELMLNSDVVIASDNCNFAQMEVQRGIMPFGGATVRFVAAAGWQKAMPYLLTGKPFDAQTADRLNLVSEVVPNGEEYKRALTIAKEICTAAPLGVKGLLSSAQDASRNGAKAALANIHSYLPHLFYSEDAKEGAMAMVERREAEFTGR